jgi:hypothetical protein
MYLVCVCDGPAQNQGVGFRGGRLVIKNLKGGRPVIIKQKGRRLVICRRYYLQHSLL